MRTHTNYVLLLCLDKLNPAAFAPIKMEFTGNVKVFIFHLFYYVAVLSLIAIVTALSTTNHLESGVKQSLCVFLNFYAYLYCVYIRVHVLPFILSENTAEIFHRFREILHAAEACAL